MNKQIGKICLTAWNCSSRRNREVGNFESILKYYSRKVAHKKPCFIRRLENSGCIPYNGSSFGTINGVSHGGLVEAISGLWQTDESSQKIVTEMTGLSCEAGFRMRQKYLNVRRKKTYFCRKFWSCYL